MDKSAVTTLVLLMCLPVLKGCVFPKECVQGYDGRVRRCCPNYKNSPCGSDLGRGYCGAVGTIRAVYPPDINEDERKDFPRFFFNETCHCYDKYMGPNCGECNFGYRGPTCKEQYNVTRRDFRELSLAEMTAYNAALHYCKSKIDPEFVIMRTSDRFRKRSFEFLEASYYDVLCFTHYYATKDLISNSKETAFSINFAHGSTGFLSWHRYYLLLTERQIQKCLKNDSWALAYYQWQYDSECFVCDNDYFGKSNINGKIESQSVYSTWRVSVETQQCL
ncbi:tyrosinase-like [Hyperolius riggenbachi]|uniref:tyrosinase-like n=1 Tax=Hyperolius riggenbachi TaxID=752182 RepID=UPI0035A35399